MGVCASVFKERMWFYAHHAGFRVCFFVGVVSIFFLFYFLPLWLRKWKGYLSNERFYSLQG